MSKGKRVLGAIYVQVSTTSPGAILQAFAQGWLRSGLLLFVLLTPPCALFGALTTRGQVRRLHQLIRATARFAHGDYTQRIAGHKQDELGQLEAQFNQMAEQLVESMARQRRLTEQQARMEERARLEQELQTAQTIQRSLLPRAVPNLVGWQIAAYYQPAREVGGDLYDFLPMADGRWGLVIGDATDKGMPAALLMASVRSMIRAAAQLMDAPGEVLAHVNDLLCADTPTRMFVTCFYALLDPPGGRLRYANAGQDLPYRRHDDGVSALWATGMPLGIMPGTRYEEQEVIVAPGDSLLLYSDGLVEAHNSRREMFDTPRLKSLLEEDAEGASLIDVVLNTLKRFTGEGWEQEDDVTLVTLHRTPASLAGRERQAAPPLLLETTVASAPGNERQAMEWVAEVVRPLHLPASRLANLTTAVAEAVMNAMEYGNQSQPDKPVIVQVRAELPALVVRICHVIELVMHLETPGPAHRQPSEQDTQPACEQTNPEEELDATSEGDDEHETD